MRGLAAPSRPRNACARSPLQFQRATCDVCREKTTFYKSRERRHTFKIYVVPGFKSRGRDVWLRRPDEHRAQSNRKTFAREGRESTHGEEVVAPKACRSPRRGGRTCDALTPIGTAMEEKLSELCAQAELESHSRPTRTSARKLWIGGSRENL